MFFELTDIASLVAVYILCIYFQAASGWRLDKAEEAGSPIVRI